MKYSEFLGTVQNQARLGTESDTVSAVRATFETLGERLAGGQAEHLAAQSPEEPGYYLRQADKDGRVELETFYKRVSEREGVDYPDAVHHAKVVMNVLEDATSPGEIRDLRSQLPDAYEDLFELNGGE